MYPNLTKIISPQVQKPQRNPSEAYQRKPLKLHHKLLKKSDKEENSIVANEQKGIRIIKINMIVHFWSETM